MAAAGREGAVRLPAQGIRDFPARAPASGASDIASTTDAPAIATPYLDRLTGPLTRGALSKALAELADAADAEQFCLADLSRSHAEEPPTVLASNWSFDAIDIIGTASIEALHQSPFAFGVAEAPRAFHPGRPDRTPRVVDDVAALRLLDFGHEEIFALKLRAGARRGVALFSAGAPGRIDRAALVATHLPCAWLVSRYRDAGDGAGGDTLSERERECLYWVAEGKTTEETALILSVSGNTVNKYIVSAIHKLGAANRAMAIAVAIRNGVI